VSAAGRFRPVRAGILNLYEYGDQVFELAGGRLLLRGHNTSGKTKALELLLPFALDGDISPRKLDPFARNAKDMRWNLVGCAPDQRQRRGYAWLEFERIGADAGVERVTAGIGLSANRELPGVRRWYFLARDRRVGDDLELLQGGEPIAKRELAEALGTDGEMIDSQAAYRQRLNELVFGFSSMDLYRTMLTLMLELRRPHLSKSLDPDGVARLLSAALPEVDGELMRRLGDGLEQLEALERGLERLRGVRERLRTFHERTYRAYLRALVRERAGALRSADSGHERSAAELREARRRLERATAEAASAEDGHRDANARRDRLEGEERAIVTSPAWASLAEVEQLGERAAAVERAARAAKEVATGQEARATTAEAEAIAAEGAAGEADRALGEELEAMAQAAAAAGLESRHRTLAAQLEEAAIQPVTWAELVEDVVRGWRVVLERHGELLAETASAGAALERRRDEEAAAAERLRAAGAARAGAEDALEARRDELSDAIEGWSAALRELPAEQDALGRAAELAHEGGAGLPALHEAAETHRRALHGERAALALWAEAAAGELRTLVERREALEAERDEEPPPPTRRAASRSGRPGAPFWRLVEFRPGVRDRERAALEAALEAMGLLDAWVTPDGRALEPGTEDAALVVAGEQLAGQPQAAETLAAALEPAPDAPVARETIERLLARVALAREGLPRARDRRPPLTGEAALDLAGGFRIGPLAGAASKDAAHYLGAAARAAHRAALIAELGERQAELERERQRLAESADALEERLDRLQAELQAFPSAVPVADALRERERAQLAEAAAEGEHEQARQAARVAADRRLAAEAAAREHAAAHALPPLLDPSELIRRRAACEGYAARIRAARNARLALDEARQRAGRQRFEQESAGAEARSARQRARTELAGAERLRAEHAERLAALGKDGDELRSRHAEIAAALAATRAELDRLQQRERELAGEIATGRAEVERAERDHADAGRERERAHTAFTGLARADAFALALGESAPEDAGRAAGWTLTRALEVVRALPAELLEVRSSSGELAREVARRVALLDRELAEADMGAYAETDAGGIVLVRVTESLGERRLAELLDALELEIAERERVLSAEQRRVFGDALLEEIAEHLRARIHEVRDRVVRMNRILERSPTAGGKSVQLEWRALDDDSGRMRAAVELLRRPMALLGERDRTVLVDFFRERIEQARHQRGEEAPHVTLAAAFDYRAWFGFGLLEQSAAGPQRLTARRHAVGSGGEQAVLIHLPLFAAAAALYEASAEGRAPRLVMLDEALSGIDESTRERVLAAAVELDLDLVMTSHELWATYAKVPSLSIYQLHRENGSFGVATVRFLWDGAVLRELEQPELAA
jgi:uncharacterized protein (TIGR02680 family)